MSNERDNRHLNDDYSSGLGPPFIHAGPQQTQYVSDYLPDSAYPNYDHPNLAPQIGQARSNFAGFTGGGPPSSQLYSNFLPDVGGAPRHETYPGFLPTFPKNQSAVPYQYDGLPYQNHSPQLAQQTPHGGKWTCPKCTFKCDEHWQLTQHLDKAHSLGADILGFEPDKGKIHWDGKTFVTKEQQQQTKYMQEQEMMYKAGAGRSGPSPRVGPAPPPHFRRH